MGGKWEGKRRSRRDDVDVSMLVIDDVTARVWGGLSVTLTARRACSSMSSLAISLTIDKSSLR